MPAEVSDDAAFERWVRDELARTSLPDGLTVVASDVVADAERLVRRRRARRRVVRGSAIALAAAVLVGVTAAPLLLHRAPDTHGTAASCAGYPVRDASGIDRLLLGERAVAGRTMVELLPSADCERHPGQHPRATVTLAAPARGQVSVGRLRGMPFYLVDGDATAVSMTGVRAQPFRTLGDQTMIWPDQGAIRGGHLPSTLTWRVGATSYTVRLHE